MVPGHAPEQLEPLFAVFAYMASKDLQRSAAQLPLKFAFPEQESAYQLP